VVKINTTIPQQCGDSCVVGSLAIDIVTAGIVLEGFAGNDEIGVGYYFVATAGLLKEVSVKELLQELVGVIHT
jgi:hypothetical protein